MSEFADGRQCEVLGRGEASGQTVAVVDVVVGADAGCDLGGGSDGVEPVVRGMVPAGILNQDCPSRGVLRHLTDRWTPMIMTVLADGRRASPSCGGPLGS